MDARDEMIESIRSEIALLKLRGISKMDKDRIKYLKKHLARLGVSK
jgi:hypothetical protein